MENTEVLLKRFGDVEVPLDSRTGALKELAAILPQSTPVQDALSVFLEAEAAKGTDAFRGYATALSLKSKSGQRILMDVKKAVKAAVGGPVEETNEAAPKQPKEAKPRKKKEPDQRCACGCGTMVHNLFAPGHDAKVHGLLLKVSRGEVGLDAISPDTLPHLKDFAIRWKIPTDADGNIVVTPRPKKAKKEAAAA